MRIQHSITGVLRLWMFLLLLPAASAQNGALINPLLDHADPFITRYGDQYILLATTGKNITLWTSPRMEDLQQAPEIVWTPSPADPLQKLFTQIWSPTLWQFGDRWWIYFTATTDGANSGHGIFALESTGIDSRGSYKFAGRVDTGKPSIDPSLLRVGGKSYLMFVSVTGGRNAVWIAPLSDPLTLARAANLLIYPDQPWEKVGWPVTEGPTALYHDQSIFIVYSGSHTASPAYCLGLLTYSGSGDITDPANWKKSGPVFESSAANQVYGPGRGTFIPSPDGRQNWILYAAKTTSKFTAAGRSVRAQTFSYRKDGTPDFGVPVAIGVTQSAPSGESGK